MSKELEAFIELEERYFNQNYNITKYGDDWTQTRIDTIKQALSTQVSDSEVEELLKLLEKELNKHLIEPDVYERFDELKQVLTNQENKFAQQEQRIKELESKLEKYEDFYEMITEWENELWLERSYEEGDTTTLDLIDGYNDIKNSILKESE